jgi:hypothetical protein
LTGPKAWKNPASVFSKLFICLKWGAQQSTTLHKSWDRFLTIFLELSDATEATGA